MRNGSLLSLQPLRPPPPPPLPPSLSPRSLFYMLTLCLEFVHFYTSYRMLIKTSDKTMPFFSFCLNGKVYKMLYSFSYRKHYDVSGKIWTTPITCVKPP